VIKSARWLKARPDYEIPFRLMNRLDSDAKRCYWLREQRTEAEIDDIGKEKGQKATEVKIAFPISHNVFTSVQEYVG